MVPFVHIETLNYFVSLFFVDSLTMAPPKRPKAKSKQLKMIGEFSKNNKEINLMEVKLFGSKTDREELFLTAEQVMCSPNS